MVGGGRRAYGNRSALQLVVAFAAQINRDVRQPRTTKTEDIATHKCNHKIIQS